MSTLEYIIWILFIIVFFILSFNAGLFLRRLKEKPNRELKFKIIFSEGLYDVMLGDRRLVSQLTFEKAKQWLDEHKDSYRQKDKVVYEEKF